MYNYNNTATIFTSANPCIRCGGNKWYATGNVNGKGTELRCCRCEFAMYSTNIRKYVLNGPISPYLGDISYD